jgi:hypothetical protein
MRIKILNWPITGLIFLGKTRLSILLDILKGYHNYEKNQPWDIAMQLEFRNNLIYKLENGILNPDIILHRIFRKPAK